ncbi:MAG: S8 family serine peptidase, partial [Acidobacteria bacterium]|nr:S8 family serine peptidase [Acidobacteriota bacterium]
MTAPRWKTGDTTGLLPTSLGHLDPQHPDALLKDVPPRLLFKPGEVVELERGALVAGLNYVMLRPEATATRPLLALHERIQRQARIIGYLDHATFQVYVDAERIGDLAKNDDIAVFHPMHPAYKVALDTGARPLLAMERAVDPVLRLEVYAVPGTDAALLRDRLEREPGVRDVLDYPLDGLVFLVRAHHAAIPALARLREVLYLQEQHEFVTSNAENTPTMQVGSFEDGLGIRPFDDRGVDGGGIDTNGDGQRVNNGTDTVPPQLVAVLDNGISADTPSFSQTATQVSDLTHPFPSPVHRKVHAIINVSGDNGAGCDAVLSGAGTHGNIVASTIAAYPSQVGAFAIRSGIGEAGQPRRANLDGVARGSRLILADIGGSSQCTLPSLVEAGGNVTPGNLTADLMGVLAAGGSQVHLAVLPFGVPNFGLYPFLPTSGAYTAEAQALDSFLYQHRDFLIVSPVGNYGMPFGLTLLPELFDGTANDNDPNEPVPPQISPPATAKNIISVGGHHGDCSTFFGTFDCESRNADFSSRGPATPGSLRTAPILVAPASDLLGQPGTAGVAAFRSRDNDNLNPVEAHLDEGNAGTSFAAGYVIGAAAVVRDYLRQGFYPLGDRVALNEIQAITGALVKAALVASANFNE